MWGGENLKVLFNNLFIIFLKLGLEIFILVFFDFIFKFFKWLKIFVFLRVIFLIIDLGLLIIFVLKNFNLFLFFDSNFKFV